MPFFLPSVRKSSPEERSFPRGGCHPSFHFHPTIVDVEQSLLLIDYLYYKYSFSDCDYLQPSHTIVELHFLKGKNPLQSR